MKTLLIILLLSLSSSIYSQGISDVSSSDGDYTSIKSSVDNGYLSVFSDQNFKPERAVSRREIALILDSILKSLDSKQLTLSELEITELQSLSKSFKQSYSDAENRLDSVEKETARLLENQALIHKDISSLNERLADDASKQESLDIKTLRKQTFLGLGVVGVLGIMLGGG